jgi:uncharacterized HAD superfamily protein
MRPEIENGVYMRRFNQELDKEFNNPNALNVAKTSRLRLAGHMDQKTRKPTTKSSIKVGRWDE